MFVNHIETNPRTRIVWQYISLNSSLWSNLLRKIDITTPFDVPTEEDSARIRQK